MYALASCFALSLFWPLWNAPCYSPPFYSIPKHCLETNATKHKTTQVNLSNLFASISRWYLYSPSPYAPLCPLPLPFPLQRMMDVKQQHGKDIYHNRNKVSWFLFSSFLSTRSAFATRLPSTLFSFIPINGCRKQRNTAYQQQIP